METTYAIHSPAGHCLAYCPDRSGILYLWDESSNPVLSASFSGSYVKHPEDKANIHFESCEDSSEDQEGTAWDLVGTVLGASHPRMTLIRTVNARLLESGLDALTDEDKLLFAASLAYSEELDEAKTLLHELIGHRCGIKTDDLNF